MSWSASRLMHAGLLLLALSGLLQACDSEAARKRTEAEVLHSFSFPSDYRAIDEWEGGNGGGGPILVYSYPGTARPSAGDVVPPAGYTSQPAVGREYELWVPALGRRVSWAPLAAFHGPTPDGKGECAVRIRRSVGEQPPLLMISAACNTEGPLTAS